MKNTRLERVIGVASAIPSGVIVWHLFGRALFRFYVGLFSLALCVGCAGNSSETTWQPQPQYNSTEEALKRSYDDAGVEYDEKMIRDDALAIEQLNRELGAN